ncbi:MAG: hypothetical protein AAGI68_01840 [Planctomycetota bacterium]
MKDLKILTVRFNLLLVIALLSTEVRADFLLATTFSGDLISVNPITAEGTLIGPTGFGALNAIDTDSEGTVYGATNDGLLIINSETGESDYIGDYGPGIIVEGLAFHQGKLFGSANLNGSQAANFLVEINRITGRATPIGAVNPLAQDLNGLAGGGLNELIGANSVPVTGNLFSISTQTGSGSISSGQIPRVITGIDADSTGNLFGVSLSSLTSLNAESTLLRIDPETGHVSAIGDIGFRTVSGIAFIPSSEVIPEPRTAVLVLLGATVLLARRHDQRIQL